MDFQQITAHHTTNIFDALVPIFSALAAAAGLASTAACIGLDFGACAGFATVSAALGIAAAILGAFT